MTLSLQLKCETIRYKKENFDGIIIYPKKILMLFCSTRFEMNFGFCYALNETECLSLSDCIRVLDNHFCNEFDILSTQSF